MLGVAFCYSRIFQNVGSTLQRGCEEFNRGWADGGETFFKFYSGFVFALICRHIPLVRLIFNNLSLYKTRWM
jgi:hypothetical protein